MVDYDVDPVWLVLVVVLLDLGYFVEHFARVVRDLGYGDWAEIPIYRLISIFFIKIDHFCTNKTVFTRLEFVWIEVEAVRDDFYTLLNDIS